MGSLQNFSPCTISLHAPLSSLPVADFVWFFGAREHCKNATSAMIADQNSDVEGHKTETMSWKTQINFAELVEATVRL